MPIFSHPPNPQSEPRVNHDGIWEKETFPGYGRPFPPRPVLRGRTPRSTRPDTGDGAHIVRGPLDSWSRRPRVSDRYHLDLQGPEWTRWEEHPDQALRAPQVTKRLVGRDERLRRKDDMGTSGRIGRQGPHTGPVPTPLPSTTLCPTMSFCPRRVVPHDSSVETSYCPGPGKKVPTPGRKVLTRHGNRGVQGTSSVSAVQDVSTGRRSG